MLDMQRPLHKQPCFHVIPGLDDLFTVSQILEILAHGFGLLSLKLDGYLVTAGTNLHSHYTAERGFRSLAKPFYSVIQHALTCPQLYFHHLPWTPSPEVCWLPPAF